MSFIGLVTTVGCDSVSFERQPYRKLIGFINLNYNSLSTCKDRQRLNKKVQPLTTGSGFGRPTTLPGRQILRDNVSGPHSCLHALHLTGTNRESGHSCHKHFALAHTPIGQFKYRAHALISRPASRTGWTRINLSGPKQDSVQLSYEWLQMTSTKPIIPNIHKKTYKNPFPNPCEKIKKENIRSSKYV